MHLVIKTHLGMKIITSDTNHNPEDVLFQGSETECWDYWTSAANKIILG